MAQIIGALISAVLVKYLDLHFMYFFVAIFALVSLLQDQKIKSVLSKKYSRSWEKMYSKAESNVVFEGDEGRDSKQTFLGAT